jgi:hypothetical protein
MKNKINIVYGYTNKYTCLIYFIDISLWYKILNIMKTVSLKIDDLIFGETEKILARIKKPRNRYINEAIDFYNKLQRKQILEKKLKKESGLVKADSISVLNDFEEIDYAD